MTDRYMVCDDCLKRYFGGSEKCCTHGYDIITGKYRDGPCSKCGQHATRLHCPDGPERTETTT